MVTFKSTLNGVDTIGLVLSAENLARLTNNELVLVPGATFGQPDKQIIIIYAESEEFAAELVRQGLINDATKVLYTGRRTAPK